MKTLSITMDEPLLQKLDRKIRKMGLGGRSEAIRQAVGEWLKKHGLRKKIQKELKGYQTHPVKPDEFARLMNSQEWPS